jgi:methionine-rich copper-binding protein CopC/putative copper export protein
MALRRALLRAGAALVVVMALLPAGTALAHAAFLGSDPADGSVLATAPASISLRFGEEVLLAASHVTLIELGPGRTIDLAVSAADDGSTLVAALPPLGKGAYVVRFVAVDPADLHKTVGELSFGVGVTAPATSGGAQVGSSWWTDALRALTDIALLLGTGAAVVGAVVIQRRRDGGAAAVRLFAAAAIAVAAGWILLFVADIGTVGWGRVHPWQLVVHTDPGRRAAIGVELAAGAWWAARIVTQGAGVTSTLMARIVIGLAAALVVLAATGGHSAIGGNSLVGVVLRALHLGSLAVWLGSVAALWLLQRRHREMRELWPTVSLLAAAGVAATGVTGFLLSGRVVQTVTALLSTTYGRLVVAKIAGLVVLAALGAVAARAVACDRVPRRIVVELGLAAAIVAVAGVLAGGSPARGVQFTRLPAADPQVTTSDVADMTVSAEVVPARPGANLVTVRVLDRRRPSPGPVQQVTLRLVRADGTEVTRRTATPAAGLVQWADVAIASPGDYQVTVDVQRAVAAVPRWSTTWHVEPAPLPRAAKVLSNSVWSPVALAGAALWAIAIGAGRWLVTRRQGSKR